MESLRLLQPWPDRYFLGRLQRRLNKVHADIQLCLIDAGSSTHSISVLLSAVERNFRTHTALVVTHRAWQELLASICVHVLRILTTATIRGYCSFCSELPFCLLKKKWLKMLNLTEGKIQNFLWGPCPQTRLDKACLCTH